MIPHKVAILDLSVILAVALLAAFLAFEFDIFDNPQFVPVRERTIELDEALTLGTIICVGLFVFSIRRYREQKQETFKRVAAEQHARRLASLDFLTGLANRRQLEEALHAVLEMPPSKGTLHAVFLVDLNGFKQINDVHGHAAGDELLTVVARRLMGVVREGDLVARPGGDEFAIVSYHLTDAESARSIVTRLIHAFDQPISIGLNDHQIGLGVGIALVPSHASTLAEALRKADIALYRAKAEPGSSYRFFEPEMDCSVQSTAAG